MTMVGLALVCCYLTKTIPDLLGGMISGTSMGGRSATGGMAAAGAAGLGAPAAASAAGARGISGGGLAGAINCSFAGASSGGSDSPLGGATSPGVGASTGGGAATPSATPSNGVQHTAKHAGKAAQSVGDNHQKAAPRGGTVNSGNALSQAANGSAKTLGVIASLTVPGMENAYSAPLGAGLPLSAPQ